VALASTGPTAQAGLDKAWPSTTFATAQLITVGYPTLAYSDALAFSSLSASSVEGSICQREAEGHARIQHNAPNTEGAQVRSILPEDFVSALSELQYADFSTLQLLQR
jgi:hypothetical protein